MSKIVLIGAGSVSFGFGTLGEIFHSELLRESEVVLVDINADALRVVEEAGKRALEENKLPTKLWATTDRNEALSAADFVVISIEVGDRFKLWDQDWSIPQQYGIRQVYGENGGPGGLFHSLRIIPPILDMCADIERICPEACVFNYSNPMSRICTAVHRQYPELNFIGLCHEVFSLERYLPEMLGVSFDELKLTSAGLNHFSCLLEACYSSTGQDAYPDIRRKGLEFFARVPGSTDYLREYLRTADRVETEGAHTFDPSQVEVTREWTERTLFRFVLEHYDLLPITTDSHFGEYVPWAYEVADHRGILDFYQYYQILLREFVPKIELKSKERVVAIMEGMLIDARFEEAAVNVPNQGNISELPDWLAVEVPAIISKNGVERVSIPTLPAAYAGLLQNQVAIHNMTAEAVITKSKKAVVQALLVDPIVDKAECLPELVDTMCSLQKDFLGYLE